MSAITDNTSRFPTLPLGNITNEDGTATQEEMMFRNNLITSLNNLSGNEGLVMPIQSQANMINIQNNKNIQGFYTCQLGTMLYIQDAVDFNKDKVVIAVRNSNDYPNSAPIFKKVTLT